MINAYHNTYYNHFQKKSTLKPPSFSKEENFLMRHNSYLEHYNCFEDSISIIYFNKAFGNFYKRGQKLTAENNKFVILNKNEGWEYLNTTGNSIDVLSFGISNPLNAACVYYLKSQTKQLLDDPFGSNTSSYNFLQKPLNADYFESGKLLKAIYNISNTEEFQYLCSEELTIEVLKSIYKEQLIGNKIANSIAVKKQSTKEETLKRLLITYEYIHDNIDKQISIHDLSLTSCLSKFHLYDSFKKAFGKTPHQYINRLKIYKAKEYLQRKQHSIGEVSDIFGFSDLCVFSKVFKKAYGKPPSHFLN